MRSKNQQNNCTEGYCSAASRHKSLSQHTQSPPIEQKIVRPQNFWIFTVCYLIDLTVAVADTVADALVVPAFVIPFETTVFCVAATVQRVQNQKSGERYFEWKLSYEFVEIVLRL